MEIRCSTQIDPIRKCNKYLGSPDLLIGKLYCKACKQANYYEVITDTGIHKLRRM